MEPTRGTENRDIKTNYYLSNTGYFDEQFINKIIHKTHRPSIYNSTSKIMKRISDVTNFPSVAYSLSEMGPQEIFRDFKYLPYQNTLNEDLNSYIHNLGISFMVGLGRGIDEYNTGVYEMPSNLPNYRVMVICFRYKDDGPHEDPRMKHGYLQIAIFFPRDVLELLPSFSSIEDQVLDLVKLHLSDQDISDYKISGIKHNVLNFVSKIIADKFNLLEVI